jgi:tetratricopeptide (TPR) repeat protein
MADYVPMTKALHSGRFLLGLLPLTVVLVGSFLAWPGDTWKVVVALWAYLFVAFSFRRLQLVHHKRGIRLVRQRAWDEAISHFQKSYDYFSRHPKLDEHRWLFLSASAIALREMALLNMAFCAAQAGRRAEARALYERTLVEYPGSPLAVSTLNLMRDQPTPSQADQGQADQSQVGPSWGSPSQPDPSQASSGE